MTEKAETRKETIKGKSNEGYTILLLLLTITIVFVSCSVFYVNTTSDGKPENSSLLSVEDESLTKNTKKLRIKSQPNCSMQEHIIESIKDISLEVYVRKVLSNPEDVRHVKKHHVPIPTVKKAAEPFGNVIIYFAVGLLLVSLVAAFFDVYKVKGKPSKSKPPLTKRCSLADLTVLRHNRRESMKKDTMVDDHRVPLKLLGSRTPPETRRCSVPMYSTESTYGNISPRQSSRKCSLDYNETHSYDLYHTRARLMRRF